MEVDIDEHPSFYKILSKGFMDKMLMPHDFVKANKKKLGRTCVLITDYVPGMPWNAKIVRKKSKFFICEGEWPLFVAYNKLEVGDILCFILIEQSIFKVILYTQKSCRYISEAPLFEELSSDEEEEDILRPSNCSKNFNMEPNELSSDSEGAVPYLYSGGKSNPKANNRLRVKKKISKKRVMKRSPLKDPDKPKRPSTAFYIFVEEFRMQFESVAAINKAAEEKWEQLSESDKAPYVAEEKERRAKFRKDMTAYIRHSAAGDVEEEESDQSMSENDSEEEESEEEEEQEEDEEEEEEDDDD